MLTNEEGRILRLNPSARIHPLLRRKRLLYPLLPPSEAERYSRLFRRQQTVLASVCDRDMSETAFASFSEGLCCWYFPHTIRNYLLFFGGDLTAAGITPLFLRAERELRAGCDSAGKLYAGAAGRAEPACRRGGSLSLSRYLAILRLSIRLIFEYDRLDTDAEESGLTLSSPETAMTAAGNALAALSAHPDSSASIRVQRRKDRLCLLAGGRTLYAGRLRPAPSLKAARPYLYSRADLHCAAAASCAAELLLFLK